LRASLLWKVMSAFALVVLVAVGSVALVARQTTTAEFRRLRQGTGSASETELVARLSQYYASHGSWIGVATVVADRRGQGQGSGGTGPPLRLTDADGTIILNTTDGELGQRLSAEELNQGDPIIVDGQRVGTLFIGGRGATTLSQADQGFLDQVQRALMAGALVAIGVALVVGFFLFRGITAPLRRLTGAASAVAQGDLSTRVPLRQGDGDEINQLGQAFNQMTADLERADQLRRDMTADIAHELRTPLTVIQGNLEAILDGVYPADAEHLEPVLRKTRLLRRLVEDLRTLALADAGELLLHPARTDLDGLLRRAVKDFAASAQASGVRLVYETTSRQALVTADAARIEQVIGILLDNSLRHTPRGGQIQTLVACSDEECRVSVRDTGRGIPLEALPQLFERFYRGKTTPARPDGSGLGLAIAHAIIAAHDGRIWAESELEKGTTITFALPAASD
jgi:signal transduction histidine kinase